MPSLFVNILTQLGNIGNYFNTNIGRRIYERSEIETTLNVVGEPSTGKTCLIKAYVSEENNTMEESTPSIGIYDRFKKEIEVNNRMVELVINDWNMNEDECCFHHQMAQSQGIIICFNLDDRASLQKVDEFWIPEMKKKYPQVPLLLVGTKRDLRDNAKKIDTFVREIDGRLLIKKYNLKAYKECSAKTGDNLKEVFDWFFVR